MKLRLSLFLLSAAWAWWPAHALDVAVAAPGTLADAVADAAGVTSLAVSGPLDASDFRFIATEMTALSRLDLGAATVAAYSGEAIDGLHSYPADVLPPMILAGTPLESIVLPAGLTALGEGALAGTRLKKIDVPAGVSATGAGAFAGCTGLEEATVASGTLGAGAFAGCTALRRVSIPAGAAVPAMCFARDSLLAAVDGFGSAVAVGDAAFTDCASLATLPFGRSLERIGARAFCGSGLREAALAGCTALTSVGEGAFAACPRLELLELPEGCEAAAALAMNSPALHSVALPAGDVPDYAFTADSLVDISAAMAAAVAVGDFAFKGVRDAGAVVFPATLEYMGRGAMEGVTGLATIDASLLQAVPALGEAVWAGVDQPAVVLYTADEMAEAFAGAAQWQDFDITPKSLVAIDDVAADGGGAAEGTLRACFRGMLLLVECPAGAVEQIAVADPAGRVLATLHPDAQGRAMLDTSRWTNSIYLLGASSGHSIKIAR